MSFSKIFFARACTVLVLAASNAFAQAADDTSSELELFALDDVLKEKVVTATGGAQERALAPANVFSFGKAEIARRGWKSVAEVIASVPGLYVIDDGGLISVGVRGVTGGLKAGTRIVKVMINGVQVNYRPDLSAFIGPEYVPIDSVERIEVAKGPLSALYGANAFLATINVITIQPEQGAMASASTRGAVLRDGRLGYGLSLLTSYATGGSSLLVAVALSRQDRSGLRIAKTFESQDPSLGRYAPFFEDESRNDIVQPLSTFVQLRTDAGAAGIFSLKGGTQSFDASGEFQLNSALTHQSRLALSNAWLNLGWERHFGPNFDATASVGYAGGAPTRDTRLFVTGTNASSYRPRSDYWALTAAADVSWHPSERFAIKLGADGEFSEQRVLFYTQTHLTPAGIHQTGEEVDLIDFGARQHQAITTAGAFLQATSTPLSVLPGLHLTGNMRIDQFSYGSYVPAPQASWRAAVVYRWSEDVVTKVIAGRAFQAPSGVLMYARPGFGNANNILGSLTLGNLLGFEALRPQSVFSAEAVASVRLFERLVLEGAVFFQQVADRIEFVQIGTDFMPTNQGALSQLGAELSLHATLPYVSPWLNASTQGTFQPSGFTLDPPPLFPSAVIELGTTIEPPKTPVAASVSLRWVGARGASPGREVQVSEWVVRRRRDV